MWRLIKYLFYLAVLGAAALAVYTLVAPLPAPTEPRVVPVSPPALE